MADDSKRIAIICGTCGSDEVSRDAWANWDTREQEWVLGSVFDQGFCHRCECESRLIEVELFTPGLIRGPASFLTSVAGS